MPPKVARIYFRGKRNGIIGGACLQLAGNGHDGETAIVGHTGTAEPVSTPEAIQQIVFVHVWR